MFQYRESIDMSLYTHNRDAAVLVSYYTVSTKRLYHNSGKQRWILMKLYANDVKLQTSCQISAKSVNICNSYSKLVRSLSPI